MQAFSRPNFRFVCFSSCLCAFDRHGALSVGVAFDSSVCLARPASEVHVFVLDFHGVGWGLGQEMRQETRGNECPWWVGLQMHREGTCKLCCI